MTTAQVVFKQLKDDFPAQDAKWVLAADVSWSPLTSVTLAQIDLANKTQWNAYGNTDKLNKFKQKIQRGERKPVILAKVKDNPKLVVLDGHHRTLASESLKVPIRAYIATITGPSEKDALDMHNEQRKGNSGVKATEQKFSNVNAPPGKDRSPSSLTSRDFHKVPAAMRRYRKGLEKQGVPPKQALQQTIAVFKQLQSSDNPVLREASKGILAALKRRKQKIDNPKQAGGDTGYSYNQAHFSRTDDFANSHHDALGKFTDKTSERERILRTFQEMNNLDVTGIMDDTTRDFLRSINKAANEDSA